MITEEKLIKTLNKLDTKPSNEWANRVVQKIQSDIFNVTKEPQQRNTFSSLFNFLSFFKTFQILLESSMHHHQEILLQYFDKFLSSAVGFSSLMHKYDNLFTHF